MEMLEANYKTYCAQNNIPVDDGPVEQNANSDARLEPELDIPMEDDPPSDPEDDTEFTGFDSPPPSHPPNPLPVMDIDPPTTPPFFQDPDQNARAHTLNTNTPNNHPKPGTKRNRRGKVATLIKEKVNKVLDETGLGDKRARMCDEGDFLRLLVGFNGVGVHFC